MNKITQVTAICSIAVNTLVMLLMFASIDLGTKYGKFESLFLFFVYFFWFGILALINFAIALVAYLVKFKERATGLFFGGLYVIVFGMIAIFAITYLRAALY